MIYCAIDRLQFFPAIFSSVFWGNKEICIRFDLTYIFFLDPSTGGDILLHQVFLIQSLEMEMLWRTIKTVQLQLLHPLSKELPFFLDQHTVRYIGQQ